MYRFKALLAVLIFSLAHPGIKGNDDGPVIKWKACSEEDALAHHECMHVQFSNGIKDVMVLTKFMGDDSVLVGHLKDDDTVTVALSKEGNGTWGASPFMASFSSRNEPSCSAFMVSEDGKAACSRNLALDRSNAEMIQTDYIPIPFEEMQKQMQTSFFPNEEQTRALNSVGYKLNVMIYYDDNMVKRFSTQQEVQTRLTAVMAHVGNMYKYPSLTTKIEFNIVGMKHLSGTTWLAKDEDLSRVRVNADSGPEANSYMFFGSENNAGGTVGLAYFRSTCSSRQYRTGINEYFVDDLKTAGVAAHELGHNLGMDHDFEDSGSNRFAKDGTTPCTDVNGIMDYNGASTIWSKCSVEDFTDYHDSVTPFCLSLLSGSASTTSSPSTTTTTSSCKDIYPASCTYYKGLYGCTGQWWNAEYCKSTCGLC